MGKLKSWLMEIQEDSQILTKKDFIKKHGTDNLPTDYFQQSPFPFYNESSDSNDANGDISGSDLSDLKAAFNEIKKI